MENNPFNTNSESDNSNQWEVSDADLKAETDEESEEKKEKPKRNLFETAKERSEREDSEKESKKPTLFEALLGKEEKDSEDEPDQAIEQNLEDSFLSPSQATIEEPLVDAEPQTDPAVAEQFEELVEDKIEAADEQIVASAEPTRVGELLADADLLESVADKLEEGQDPVKAIDNATEELLENPLPDGAEIDIQHEAVSVEAEQLTVEDMLETPPPPSSSRQSPPPVIPSSTSSSRSSQQPPSLNMPGMQQNYYLNTMPSQGESSPATDPELVPMNDTFDREPNTGRVIASGLLGYMVGRRGGRKRTEAKMQPVIDSQKQQLEDLNTQLEASEELVKKAAASQTELAAKNATLKTEAEQAEDAMKDARIVEIQAETIAQEREEFLAREQQLTKALDSEEATKKTEAAMHAEQAEQMKAVESLKLLEEDRLKEEVITAAKTENQVNLQKRVETEEEKRQEKTKSAIQAEQKAKEKARLQEAKRNVDARQMTLPRLLEVAEFIPLKEGNNLRQLYEARRIDAVNLRRVVTEYLNGGNYEKSLEHSLEAVELRNELKHEVKQDDSIYKHPEQTSHNVVDGLIAATKTESASTTDPQPVTATEEPEAQLHYSSQVEETGMFISNGTAIVLGIGAGILITFLILLYSGRI